MNHHDLPAAGISPLASLTAGEIDTVRTVIASQADWNDTTRFVYVGLDEPAKSAVLDHQNGIGPAPARRARAMLLDMASGRSTDVLVSLEEPAVESVVELDGSVGQLPILVEEFDAIGPIVAEDPRWIAALDARGLTIDDVTCVPLSAGNYGLPEEAGRRIIRTLAFRQDHPRDHPWAHPIEGLCAYVDMADRRITRLIDTGVEPVPSESGNFDDPAVQGPPLTGLRPIEITQPEGPSFQVEGETISWANWRFRIGFDMREGLVLRNLAWNDGTEERPIVYRASISEMVVPYGDPSPIRFWQNYFDLGEYLFGRFTNPLELGCDCLGEIHYFDAVLADELGRPTTIPNAICMHEEDYGTLWKHTDMFAGSQEVRRSRRLVISTFTTVGNYDYGFYWYLYLDGTIECEAKLTGILFTGGYNDQAAPYASEVAPGLAAPYHQHLFSARLDMTVDGVRNTVDEVDAVRIPMGPDNIYGEAFTKSVRRLETEQSAAREADGAVGRVWHIGSSERTNRLGHPTAYALIPQHAPTLLADEKSTLHARATFASKHLWVTRYDPAERYAAGDFVHQSVGGAGLPAFVAGDDSVDGEDIVVWHTFGPTHFPRIEDWPVMPTDYAKFTLRPVGFFDRNPVLNVPAALAAAHCSPGADHAHGAHHGHAH